MYESETADKVAKDMEKIHSEKKNTQIWWAKIKIKWKVRGNGIN